MKERTVSEYLSLIDYFDLYRVFIAIGNANVTSPKSAPSPKQAASPNNKSPRAIMSPTKSLRLLDSTDNAFMLGPQGSWLNTLFKASEVILSQYRCYLSSNFIFL